MRVGVARASTQDMALTAVAPKGTEIMRFDDDATAVQALLSGQVDAIGCSTRWSAADREDGARRTLREKFVLRHQSNGVALRTDQADLLAVGQRVHRQEQGQRRA